MEDEEEEEVVDMTGETSDIDDDVDVDVVDEDVGAWALDAMK